MIHSLPERFLRFAPILEQIVGFNPKEISIVGSYGNKEKTPSPFSDFDIVFIFHTAALFDRYSSIVETLTSNDGLQVVELGVHYQFGYVICLYFRDNPMVWVDIGIMDEVFAYNYMICKPKTDILGSFKPAKNGDYIQGHMNHLARKILLAFRKKDLITAKISAYRYIGWIRLYLSIRERIQGNNGLVGDFLRTIESFDDRHILKYVIDDFCVRFPELNDESRTISFP